jgi:flagellar FliL protein
VPDKDSWQDTRDIRAFDMTAMNTFEIRTFKNGRWLTESRCGDQGEAIATANALAGDRTIDGVKVIEEAYNESDGLFREKTVFSYFKQDDKVFNPRLERKGEDGSIPAAPAIARHKARADRGGDMRAWLLVLALVISLGGNLGLALYLGNPGSPTFNPSHAQLASRAATGDLVVYDLPPVTMNYAAGHGIRAVKMRLGLELASRQDGPDVQLRLSQIINRVATDLSDIKESDLDGSAGMERLRKSLVQGVQSAAPQSNIEGVLFKEVIVF